MSGWHKVHFAGDEAIPVDHAGEQLAKTWGKFRGKEVSVQFIPAEEILWGEPACNCTEYFKVAGYRHSSGQTPVVCRRLLEMD